MLNQTSYLTKPDFYLVFLMFFLLLLLATPAAAKQVEAGKVLMATVGVTAQKQGAKPRAMERRSAIYVGDTLKTPEGGRAQIRMADGEMLSLTASSELKIEAFKYQPDTTAKNSNVKNLVTGGLRTITGAVKGEDYEMKSRAGTIGIRGTAFEVYSQQGQNLFVNIQRGNVVVRNSKGSVDIGVNQKLTAARISGLNQAPEAISVSELPKFFEDAFAQDTTLSLAGGGNKKEEKAKPMIFSKPVTEESLIQTGMQYEVGKIENRLEVVKSSLGPFGFVIRIEHQSQGGFFAGQFFKQLIGINKLDYTYNFNGQQGQGVLGAQVINSFNFDGNINKVYMIGGSEIYIGNVYDSSYEHSYVFATNIHDTLASLPSVGNYTYNLVDHLGQSRLKSGALSVNFATGMLGIALSTHNQTAQGSGKIQDFYNSSIGLSGNGLNGSITGRFVGNDAEAAIATYKLQENDFHIIGTAVFDRTGMLSHHVP